MVINLLFSRLLKKAILMALWTKASLCIKSSLLEQSLPKTPSRPKTSMTSVNPVILSNFSLFLCAFCAFLWLKNPRNLRNLRLKYSCQYSLCLRGIFTTVERSLQISPFFMQNEPNFRKSQMNITKVLTRDYKNKCDWTLGENEPKTNPKRTQTNPISEAKKCCCV